MDQNWSVPDRTRANEKIEIQDRTGLGQTRIKKIPNLGPGQGQQNLKILGPTRTDRFVDSSLQLLCWESWNIDCML